MEEAVMDRRKYGLRARNREWTQTPPGTFRDGRMRSMMPSTVSARARWVCFGWVTGGNYFIQWMYCFYSIIQVVIKIRKKLTSAECVPMLCHWLAEFSEPCEVPAFLFKHQEVELDEASWLIQGHPASKQQCQNLSSFYSTPNTHWQTSATSTAHDVLTHKIDLMCITYLL